MDDADDVQKRVQNSTMLPLITTINTAPPPTTIKPQPLPPQPQPTGSNAAGEAATEHILFGIPKKGRLAEQVLKLIKGAGE